MASAVSSAVAGKNEPAWPTFKPTKPDPVLGKKEMSPEQSLIEFISTSAGLHGVKKQSLRSLEWDILKVFPYNIMPANAAAWYMAKRKYYSDQPPDLQLLPFLLKKYPDKFKVNKFQVEFLENYSKETAKKKLNYLVQFGLDAYFSHKVDEYGVYFFDPQYYEMTEPFHESLRITGKAANKNKLVASYFNQLKHRYVFASHSSSLASLSKLPGPKIMTNTTGVIVSMVNNQYGFLKFGSGEKALFCAKGVFRDGWQYTGDPLRLPAMYFDAYQVPSGLKSGAESCKWFAVLVWCGRKPAPKFYSSLADFNQASGSSAFLRPGSPPALAIGEGRKLRQPSSSMMIGQVVSIRKNGGVISVREDSEEQVFVPGWSKENASRPGIWLTTLTGDTIGLRDLVAYYVASDETMPGFTAVAKNVMVLKEHQEVVSSRKPPRRSRMSVSLSGGARYEASDNDSQYLTEVSESEDESVGEPVSDSELEWLENDLEEIIEEEGPDAKTHTLFMKLKNTLKDVRASAEKKGRSGKRDGRDSGMGSHPTTPRSPTKSPRSNQKLKVGKRPGANSEEVFWRTKAAFASINSDYRSSDDEEYEYGDDINSIELPRHMSRQRLVSTTSTMSTTSRRVRGKRSEACETEFKDLDDRKASILPYWVRALTMPEEYDETTGKFVPVDKWYHEEKDPDYYLPETDDEEELEEEQEDEKDGTIQDEEAVKAEEGVVEDDLKKDTTLDETKELSEESLDDELKLLLEEVHQEIPEELLEGLHRGSPVKLESPEKIVVTKPKEEDDEKEEVVEIITIEEPFKYKDIWYSNSYIQFKEGLLEDLDDDVTSNMDPEYVPPCTILDSDLDYDEYEDDKLDAGELESLEEEMETELCKAANYIPIWVHVDSVKERKARAEEEQKEREAMLAAAQELEAIKEAAEKEEAAEREAVAEKEEAAKNEKKAAKEAEGSGPEVAADAQPKPQRNNSVDGKVTRAKVEADVKKASPSKAEESPKDGE